MPECQWGSRSVTGTVAARRARVSPDPAAEPRPRTHSLLHPTEMVRSCGRGRDGGSAKLVGRPSLSAESVCRGGAAPAPTRNFKLSACGGAAGSVAHMSETRREAAGCAGAGGSPQGSDRSLEGALEG
jgi:hypothetical protein